MPISMRSIAVLLLCFLSTLSAWAGSVDLDYVDARAQEFMEAPGMAGLSVAIVENGEIVFTKGYGETAKGTGDKVTADTVFRWASVSKGVAAATVLSLSNEGYFEMDEAAQVYAPSLKLPKSKYPATIEHILSHRVGVTRNAYDRRIEDGKYAKDLRTALSELKRVCDPGTCHTYQNVAFDSAAEIAETATGLPYKSVVAERIFKPLAMETASTTIEGLTRSKSWAKPHYRSGKTINQVKKTYYRIPAAAGVNSSITDLAKWMQAQMATSEPGLPSSIQASLQTPRVYTTRENKYIRRKFRHLRNAHYGYGFRIYDYKGRRVVGHRGAVQGYRSLVLFDPELNTGIAMMWNSGHHHPVRLQTEILDQLYSESEKVLFAKSES